MSTMVPCATATGPILVESDAVFGVWAVHEQVVTGRRGRMLMHDVFTVTHVPSGMALMQDAARAPAMFMAQGNPRLPTGSRAPSVLPPRAVAAAQARAARGAR